MKVRLLLERKEQDFGIQFQFKEVHHHIRMSSKRPVREKRQPKRDQDTVELNLELIEKLETSRKRGIHKEEEHSCAKVLSNFINSANKRLLETRMQILSDKNIAQKPPPNLGHQNQAASSQKSEFSSGKQMPQGRAAEDAKRHKASDHSKRPEQLPHKDEEKQVRKKNGETGQIETDLVFNRATFHVGIAYSVYLSTMKQKFPSMQCPAQFDPTYAARRLKHQQEGL